MMQACNSPSSPVTSDLGLPLVRADSALVSSQCRHWPDNHDQNCCCPFTNDDAHLDSTGSSLSNFDSLAVIQSLGLEGLVHYDGNTNGPIVPRSIDQLIVVTDDEEEEEKCDGRGRGEGHDDNQTMGHGAQHQSIVQLTHRQQKAMQNRLDTLRRIKQSKALQREQLDDQTDSSSPPKSRKNSFESDDSLDSGSKPMPLSHQLGLNSNMVRYRSSPNLVQHETITKNEKDDFRTRQRKRLQKIRQFFTGNRHKNIHEEHHNKIDTDEQSSQGVKIRYFKYNASYRKANRKTGKSDKHFPVSYLLLEPIQLQPEELPVQRRITDKAKSKSSTVQEFYWQQQWTVLNDFGVNFIIKNQRLMELSLHKHVTFYEDLTKNLALAGSTVALMELQADLDSMGQKILAKMPSFNKNHRKNHPNFLFGGYLTQLHYIDADRLENGCECPSFFKHIIDYLVRHGIQEEGIFRIPGTKIRLEKLQEELTQLFTNYYKTGRPDNPEEIFELLSKYSIHDVASLLKLFLRQLAQPLLTSELVDIFLLVPTIPNLYEQIKILNLLMLTLNDTHRNSLCVLLNLLNLVVQNEHCNKMTLDSMTTIMAPNLFVASHSANYPQSFVPGQPLALRKRLLQTRRMSLSSQTVNEISGEMAYHLERTNYQLQVLKLLINLQPILFHIPPYIYRQIK